MPTCRLLFPLLLTATLTAQRVVVVDANGGAGVDYTDLTGAFAGLLENDVILVHAGTYTGLATQTYHSFVMIGEGNPVVEPAPSTGASLQITMNGSQYQRIAIRGMTFHSRTTGQWALSLRTNYAHWPAPCAQVEDCTVLSLSPNQDRLGLQGVSIGLTVQRCTMNTTSVSGCLASFVECSITGLDQSYSGPVSQGAQTALDVSRSEVWIRDSQLTAGNSHAVYGSPANCVGFSENDYTVTSKVHVAGNSLLRADPSPNPQWPLPDVVHHYQTWWPLPSTLEYEAGVIFVPAPLGGLFGANIATSQQTVHSLNASTAPLGGAWTCTAYGDDNDLAMFVVSAVSRGNTLLGLPLLMDTTAATIADFGLVGGGQWTFAPLAIPNDPQLLSIVLQATSIFLTPAGALLGSNPVSGVLFQ